MTDQNDQGPGGIATMEPASPNGASPDQLAQTPLDPIEPSADDSQGARTDRRAAREQKRADRGERRLERKERKLDASVVAAPLADAADPSAALDADAIAPDALSSSDAEAEAAPLGDAGSDPTSNEFIDAEAVEPLAASEPGDLASDDPDQATARSRNGNHAERLERKAARRAGKESADAPSREERRADREERRAERPAKPTRPAANGVVAEVDESAAPNGVESAPRPPVLVRADIGVVPGDDGKSKRTERMAGRVDVQRAAAEEVLGAVDPNNAAIAPLIRYVNAVTMHLNESQKMIGQLQVERDALRAQVVSLDADPIDASRFAELAGATDQGAAKQRRRSERQAAQATEGEAPESDDAAPPASMDDVGRKRRLIALGALAVIGLIAMATRFLNHPIDLSNMSKGSLGGVAVVGQFMQVFLAGMIFYRLARIGGRGARWLFPESDPKLAKKQMQEAKVRQKLARQADA